MIKRRRQCRGRERIRILWIDTNSRLRQPSARVELMCYYFWNACVSRGNLMTQWRQCRSTADWRNWALPLDFAVFSRNAERTKWISLKCMKTSECNLKTLKIIVSGAHSNLSELLLQKKKEKEKDLVFLEASLTR